MEWKHLLQPQSMSPFIVSTSINFSDFCIDNCRISGAVLIQALLQKKTYKVKETFSSIPNLLIIGNEIKHGKKFQ